MKNEVKLNISVEFFPETPSTVQEVMQKEFTETLDGIMNFMASMGIEKLTLSGKTPDQDTKLREYLKNSMDALKS